MNGNFITSIIQKLNIAAVFVFILAVAGCSDDDETGSVGYAKLYNISENSPAIYLQMDIEDDDDFETVIHSGVSYTKASSRLAYDVDTYDIELSWKDEGDYEMVYENQLSVSGDSTQLIVFSGDVSSPIITYYDIPVIDDDDDYDDDVFNIRFLNTHEFSGGIDIYYSDSDETFNEAVLVGYFDNMSISSNQKIEAGEYVFYITESGRSEVLYRSNEVKYLAASQYIMAVRKNQGVGFSPFTIDKISESSIAEYQDADAEAEFRVYNAIAEHELLPEYSGSFDLKINNIDVDVEIPNTSFSNFSNSYRTVFGDYSISLTDSSSQESIIANHLLTLDVNSDKSVFFYLSEENVDDDGDGDVDEDGDGVVDEVEVTINSLVVENSHSENIFQHEVSIINLVDDYDHLKAYFVKSDETIDTSDYSTTAYFGKVKEINLTNNSYNIFIVANENSSELILANDTLTLAEDSKDLFLIIEKSEDSPTGYKMQISNQNDEL
jgi:hypothetical protein